jgi:hypothetical protein
MLTCFPYLAIPLLSQSRIKQVGRQINCIALRLAPHAPISAAVSSVHSCDSPHSSSPTKVVLKDLETCPRLATWEVSDSSPSPGCDVVAFSQMTRAFRRHHSCPHCTRRRARAQRSHGWSSCRLPRTARLIYLLQASQKYFPGCDTRGDVTPRRKEEIFEWTMGELGEPRGQ